MALKKKAKKTAKKAAPKKTRKAAPKKKAAAEMKKGQSYECRVCGFRVIVDKVCGCSEEHVLVCCGKPMR